MFRCRVVDFSLRRAVFLAQSRSGFDQITLRTLTTSRYEDQQFSPSARRTGASVRRCPYQSQNKIGGVDLRKMFDGYYKTNESDTKIEAEANELEKTFNDMLEAYKVANEDKQLQEGVADPTISGDKEQRRLKVAEDRLFAIRTTEQQVRKYQLESEATLLDKRRLMRDQVLRQIRVLVAAMSMAAEYTHVFDVAAESVNQTPNVLHNNGKHDTIAEMLRPLNTSAPAGSLGNDGMK